MKENEKREMERKREKEIERKMRELERVLEALEMKMMEWEMMIDGDEDEEYDEMDPEEFGDCKPERTWDAQELFRIEKKKMGISMQCRSRNN